MPISTETTGNQALDTARDAAHCPMVLRSSHLAVRPVFRRTGLVLGWLLIALGLAGLVLPALQGILTLLAGAAVLSLVSETVHCRLRSWFRRWPAGWRRFLRVQRRVHGLVSRSRLAR